MMFIKRIRLLLVLVLTLTLTGTALAQGPVYPQDSDPTWRATYWNNTSLSGTPVVERHETDLNHDWGGGSPQSSVSADRFSARWTRYIYVTEADYRFTVTSDDGIRVWVDNQLIINEWHDHAATTFTAEKHLSTGHHWVVVEYYENQGFAVAKVRWGPTVPPVDGWLGEYWDNRTLSGFPDLIREDDKIDFNWGALSPDTGVISVDNFSARWTRTLDLPAGHYRFSMTVDDGGRLWVNHHLLINAWREQPATTYTAEVYLPGGAVPIKMDYYEKGGNAVAKLSWEALSPTIQNWRGEYWNNTTLDGATALVRDDAHVNFDWGSGSPASGVVDADGFSARWTRTINLSAGRYRFVMTVDDGARLWVKNQLLIDAWRDQAATTYSAEIDLPGGNIPIKMEYYEDAGLAVARLSWSTVQAPAYRWRGEYYNNMTLSDSPSLIRDDDSINFDWGNGSPASGTIDVDRFSVRWTRTLDLSAGHYRFTVTADDGVRLWVKDHLLIDAWRDQAATTYTGEMYLPGGPAPIKMEYYENGGLAVARLGWALIGQPQTPGTVIVDDTDAGFAKGGSVTSWRTAYEGYNGRLLWTKNNDWERPNYNWARWYPTLNPGRYEVFVYIPERYSTTAGARYGISHAGGFSKRVVNQSTSGGRWVSLGTYWFSGTRNDYVSLTDATNEPRLSRLIAFDAVKWVPR